MRDSFVQQVARRSGTLACTVFLLLTQSSYAQPALPVSHTVKSLGQNTARTTASPHRAPGVQQSSGVLVQDSSTTITKDPAIEFDGLVVDETQTKLGHDFYDLFFAAWEPPGTAQNYTVVISEKPLPRLGTQVSIRVNDTDVFQEFLQPRYDAIEEMAAYGIQSVLSYLENFERIEDELQGKDMQGTGIY